MKPISALTHVQPTLHSLVRLAITIAVSVGSQPVTTAPLTAIAATQQEAVRHDMGAANDAYVVTGTYTAGAFDVDD